MQRWAFLFRPAWLALFVVVLAFAYLCFTVLAPWQQNVLLKLTTMRDPLRRDHGPGFMKRRGEERGDALRRLDRCG